MVDVKRSGKANAGRWGGGAFFFPAHKPPPVRPTRIELRVLPLFRISRLGGAGLAETGSSLHPGSCLFRQGRPEVGTIPVVV